MRHRSLPCLLLLLAAFAAGAGELHRCVSRTGQVSYLSASCPDGQRTDRILQFVPDPVPAPVTTRTGKASASGNRQSSRQRTVAIHKPERSPCQRAKARREAQLDQLGLKRTFDDLSRIDAAVRVVCNGF